MRYRMNGKDISKAKALGLILRNEGLNARLFEVAHEQSTQGYIARAM